MKEEEVNALAVARLAIAIVSFIFDFGFFKEGFKDQRKYEESEDCFLFGNRSNDLLGFAYKRNVLFFPLHHRIFSPALSW